MILVIDNYDSFTYNLVQALGELGADIHVCRNDKITVAEVEELSPERMIISPGPCTPTEAGISCEAIKAMSGKVPILGVCLGHQSIAQAFGGEVIRADQPIHGKTSMIRHNGQGVFAGLDNPLEATRYHSLIVREPSLPECLEATAWTVDSDILMGIRHREHPVFGVQFHPESFLTASGSDLLRNFLEL